jgi:dCTP deaminase
VSILTGPEIRRIVERTKKWKAEGFIPQVPSIDITQFDPESCGPNSYDVRLADTLLVYERNRMLDMRAKCPTRELKIPAEGIELNPGILYLASTIERTATAGLVPYLEGRSSVGRLGIFIHSTAGRGDDGFGMDNPDGCPWTLELSVVQPVRVYAGVRIGQLTYYTIEGERKAYSGKYARDNGPAASRMHEDTR